MNRILILCGPTATGKSRLGLELAKQFNGEIVSADSRQVYKGMDVGTGKGLPSNSQFSILKFQNSQGIGCYQVNGVNIWGYDLVEPNQAFSVAEYRELMLPVIEEIWSKNMLPIIVGGTGFYIESLVEPSETVGYQLDSDLRGELETVSVQDLQKRLKAIDPQKISIMNNSDVHNPRRLIRAIEVATQKSRGISGSPLLTLPKTTDGHSSRGENLDKLWLGLTSDKDTLRKRVQLNVEKRATDSLSNEIKKLDGSGLDWDSPSGSACGYREWKLYMSGSLSLDEAKSKWITREYQYQKRQLTWFKKNPVINWFDISEPNLLTSVADRVNAW